MSEYIAFYKGTWADRNFTNLSTDYQLLFIYLFTNPDVNLCGIYDLDVKVCQLKMNNINIEKGINEISEKKMIEFDSENQTIWVVNRFKRIPNNSSPKIIACIMQELTQINHPFREKFIKKYHSRLSKDLWRLSNSDIVQDEKYNIDYFLKPETLLYLSKTWDKKKDLKKFLMNRNCPEQRIDEILPQVLPNLK